MSVASFKYCGAGIYLPALKLWLDPHEPQIGADRVFVSHAHSDHIGEHREVILSEPTARFMRARLGGKRLEHVLAFGQPTAFETNGGPWQITLLPAGHIFGSALSLIETEGESLLYTGDFNLRRGLSAEPCEPRRADTLIMETTYGRPEYHFPPTSEVLKGVIRFCHEAIDNDETPVLLGYSLGKSQELLRGLADAGLSILLQKSVYELTQIYEQLGQTFPPYEKFEGKASAGKVFICPPMSNLAATMRKAGKVRTAILTGWAVDPNCRFRYQTDAAFPLSDHADFPELVEFVKRIAPKRIYTLHGFAADFARTLREMGFDAHALSEEEQLALPLAVESFKLQVSSSKSGSARPAEEPTPAPSQEGNCASVRGDTLPSIGGAGGGLATRRQHERFSKFAATCDAIAAVSGKLEKVRLLAEYLATLEGEPLAWVTTWFTGYPFPPSRNKVLQLGGALISEGLCTAGQLTEADLRQIYLRHSDGGETAFEVLSRNPLPAPTHVIESIHRLFEQLQGARGPSAKLPLLVQALRQCTPIEGKFLVKIFTGELRIGLKEGLVEEASAKAFDASLEEIKRANLLLGDIGETARLAQRRELASVSLVPFRPVKFMLASPEESAAQIWERMRASTCSRNLQVAPGVADASSAAQAEACGYDPVATVWLEDKYDGVRCQLHKVGDRVALYSRDLKDITDTFFDIAEAARELPGVLILDGEILAVRGDQVLPFADLQKRLGRRQTDLFLGEEIPVRYIAFDLLWRDGKSLLEETLKSRRTLLEILAPLPPAFGLARITEARSADDIENAFTTARARGNEGLMIKDPDSAYSPGRRGLAWLKMKKAYATLDCVVVGAEYGHGKRKNVLSDYTFAVRDDETGALKTIGSARHTSGLAMRFPRIVRIRTDKTPSEIDTVASARKLVQR